MMKTLSFYNNDEVIRGDSEPIKSLEFDNGIPDNMVPSNEESVRINDELWIVDLVHRYYSKNEIVVVLKDIRRVG